MQHCQHLCTLVQSLNKHGRSQADADSVGAAMLPFHLVCPQLKSGAIMLGAPFLQDSAKT